MNIEEAKKKIENCDTGWYCKEAFDTLLKEIERLSNIIKELEKFVENCNEYNSKCNSTIYEARAFEDSVILYKIKELKGEGNSE